jgi:hypothetical protein
MALLIYEMARNREISAKVKMSASVANLKVIGEIIYFVFNNYQRHWLLSA